MANRTKRIVFLSCPHCGHRTGLTPPALWWSDKPEDYDGTSSRRRAGYGAIQRICWNWYSKTIESLRPIDILCVVGDAIDGKGYRSGGNELVTTDRHVQYEMAETAFRLARAKNYVFIRGTRYHTGVEEDWEDHIAKAFPAASSHIHNHKFLQVNGIIFDIKHKVSSSDTPYGRATAIEKQRIWNQEWAIDSRQPLADVVIRAHVHYHKLVSGIRGAKRYLCLTLPSMQELGTEYGERECSGPVDYGLIYFDVPAKGGEIWPVTRILRGEHQKAQPLIL